MAHRLTEATIADDGSYVRLRRKTEEDAELHIANPMRPLWGGLAMFGYFALLAALAVAGVDLSSTFPTVALFFLSFLAMIVGLSAMEDSVTVRDWQGRPIVLTEQRFRRRSRIWLDELAAVERERVGQRETLRLTDVRGTSVSIPLRNWPGEQRLLDEIADAAAATGAAGEAGDVIEIRQPRWVRAAWPALVYGGVIGWISVLIILEVSR